MFFDDKMLYPQPYKFVMLVEYAQRSPKVSFSLRENRVDSLGRIESFYPVLQIFRSTLLSSTSRSMAALFPSEILSGRSSPGSYLCHRSWHRPNREYPIPSLQRIDSPPSRSARIPSPRYPKNIPMAIQQNTSDISANSSRQIQKRAGPTVKFAVQRRYRCRYNQPDYVWPSRRRGCRLSAQKASWQILLCADYFQRGQNGLKFGHGTALRQRQSLHRGMAVFGANPQQTPFDHSGQSHTTQTGRRFLRQGYYTTPGREKLGICHCCQNDNTSQRTDGLCSLSRIRPRMGSRRVYIYSFSLEQRTSFRGYPQTTGHRTRGHSETSFYFQALHLSQSIGRRQPCTHSRICLSFLLRQGIPRTPLAGIQRFIQHGSDSYPKLLGQCRLHGNDPMGLRSGLGFSIPVFAQRSSTLEYIHITPRVVVVASRMGQKRNQQYLMASNQTSTTRFVLQDSKSDQQCKAVNTELNRFANELLY